MISHDPSDKRLFPHRKRVTHRSDETTSSAKRMIFMVCSALVM